MKKSKILALTLSCAMAISLFAGCAKTDEKTETTTVKGDTTAQQTTEKKGDVRTDIVIGESSDVVTLDPIEVSDNYSAKCLWMINDNLMKLNENTEIVPWLAESYEEVSPTEYVFHIRKGVKFHNGEGKALMAEAGYPDGFSCEIAVASDDNSRIAQVLQSSWSEANVTLDISVMEFGALLSYLDTGAHDMFILAWSQGNTNPDKTLTNNFHSDMIGTSGNRSYLDNADVDSWIEGARQTTDVAKQKELYGKVQQYVMENAIWIPVYQAVTCTAYNKDADGIIWFKHGGFDYTNMVIGK